MELSQWAAAVDGFSASLTQRRKAPRTARKYAADVRAFLRWARGRDGTPEQLLREYGERLARRFKASTCNSYLISLNAFLSYLGRDELRQPLQRVQKRFALEHELTLAEYTRILGALRSLPDPKYYLIARTLAGSGIRVGELQFITLRAVGRGWAEVRCKDKARQIFLPLGLQRELTAYALAAGRRDDEPIFQNKRETGAISGSCVWRRLKAAARMAGVDEAKAFPHNLRHLFARTYMGVYGNIVELADLLGHNSIETTRIYTRTSCPEMIRRVSGLGL